VIDRVTSVTQPESGGTVTISADGQGILYSPAPGFSGTDVFTYLADGVHEAQVRVSVTRPVRDDNISTGVYQDTPNAVLSVLANDFVGNGYTGPRLITAVGATENGGTVTISGDGKALLYTPKPGYTGTDRFTYTVDGTLVANVNVYVESLAQGDSAEFCPDPTHEPYVINVLSNDHFNKGYAGPGVITAAEVLSETGQVLIQDGKSLAFDPAMAGWHTIRYTVDDKYEATLGVSIRNIPAGGGSEFALAANQCAGERLRSRAVVLLLPPVPGTELPRATADHSGDSVAAWRRGDDRGGREECELPAASRFLRPG
jgi:hypothetical protein